MDAVKEKADLAAHLAAEPGVVIETTAKEFDVTPRDVVEALPQDMRRFAPGAAFVEVMQEIGGWGDVTAIVHTDDGIFEYSGPVARGEIGRGYYNIPGRTGFHGHLRHERCTGIAFIERPFMGRPSAVIVFFNPEGGIMLKVFVGRDQNRELKTDQLTAFRTIAARFP